MENTQSEPNFKELYISLPKNHELNRSNPAFGRMANFRSMATATLKDFCWPLKETTTPDGLSFKVLVKTDDLSDFRQKIKDLGFEENEKSESNGLDKTMERED